MIEDRQAGNSFNAKGLLQKIKCQLILKLLLLRRREILLIYLQLQYLGQQKCSITAKLFKDKLQARMTSFLTTVKDKFQTRYKLDVNKVVKEYNAFLQYPLVTSSSFQDILDGKLNARRRALQLTLLLHYWLYVLPRYCFVCLLYFQDEKTRMHYQYNLADYAEEMGILGRTFNPFMTD